MLGRIGERLEAGSAHERESHLELFSDLPRVETYVCVDLEGYFRTDRRGDAGGNVHLLDKIEERDVVALLIEAGTGREREHVAMGHEAGAFGFR